jgi:hypothetical protein
LPYCLLMFEKEIILKEWVAVRCLFQCSLNGKLADHVISAITVPTYRPPMGDNQAMRGRRFKVLTTVASIALLVFLLWLVKHLREQRKAAEREAYYQSALAKYGSDLKPGMSREQVEQRLQTNGKRFSQMCCVANFTGEHASLVGSSWDDLVKIGEESPPWFCSEHNVYIAFEFNPKSQGERLETNPSDTLKRVSVFHHLEGCL